MWTREREREANIYVDKRERERQTDMWTREGKDRLTNI